MRVTLTPAERDDLTLALREWIAQLEEPTTDRALNRRRAAKARQLDKLCERLSFADLPKEA